MHDQSNEHNEARRYYYKHFGAAYPTTSYRIMVNGKVWKDGYSSATRAFKVAVKVSRMNADKEYTVVHSKGKVINRLVNGVDQVEHNS